MFVNGWKWQSGKDGSGKDGPLSSPAVLWVVNINKKKTLIEKKKKKKEMSRKDLNGEKLSFCFH